MSSGSFLSLFTPARDNTSLSDCEIMTILIVFQSGSFRTFKHYYLFFIKEHLKSYFSLISNFSS